MFLAEGTLTFKKGMFKLEINHTISYVRSGRCLATCARVYVSSPIGKTVSMQLVFGLPLALDSIEVR